MYSSQTAVPHKVILRPDGSPIPSVSIRDAMVGGGLNASLTTPPPEPVSTRAMAPSDTAALDKRLQEARLRKPRVTFKMTGNEWIKYARKTFEQKQLCGPLWYEGEVCILFADTNIGKSMLAVQIADMIARGSTGHTDIPELRPETFAQPVIYADFEMSLTQFARRYTAKGPDGMPVYYPFADGFTRVELSYDSTDEIDTTGKQYADQIIADLELHVIETGAQVLIVDNITFTSSGTETAAEALPLMKRLIELKKRHDLSILLLAHTPKRDPSRPIDRNDIQGSKMLINFADSAFAIGESRKGSNIRYIKQIKQRNCEKVFDADNVLVCEIQQLYNTFVGFSSVDISAESEHLAECTVRNGRNKISLGEELTARMGELKQLKDEGLGVNEIIERMSISRATFFRMMKKMKDDADIPTLIA